MRRFPSTEIGDDLAKLRVALLEEEVGEFVTASEKGDLIGIADALADIVYVVYGTALTYGIDLDSVLREVHRSNMSKLAADGKPLIREDGKVLKSEQYFPPDIASALGLPDVERWYLLSKLYAELLDQHVARFIPRVYASAKLV